MSTLAEIEEAIAKVDSGSSSFIPSQYMQATTIKLDPKLHSAIRRLKAPKQSLTGYVRDLVVREEKRAALESAAETYAALVSGDREESRWLAEWESAPLASAPKRRRK